MNNFQFDGSSLSPFLPLVQELTATLLCKLSPGQSEVAEELCLRLQHKEKMLQDLLSDRNHQTMEHDAEIRELLQALSTKEQQSRVSFVQCHSWRLRWVALAFVKQREAREWADRNGGVCSSIGERPSLAGE